MDWKNVNDEMPEPGVLVLVAFGCAEIDPELDYLEVDAEWGNEYWANCNSDDPEEQVEFWCALPEHPNR